jgi:MSHA biogenesis protein MshQ
MEYSGVGAVDQKNSATGVTATALVSTPAATAVNNELIVSSLGILWPAASFASISPSAGYTARGVQLNNNGQTAGGGADQLTNTAGIKSVTWTGGSAFSGWVAALATFRPSATLVPDHYALSGSASQVNCQAAPITISAHNNTHGLVSTVDQIALSTSTGHGDWSLTSGSGSFAAGASDSGAATYTYSSGDAGTVVLSLRDTHPETVSINVVDGTVTEKSGSALASEDPAITFAPSGFRITNGSNAATAINTLLAGAGSSQPLALQAIRTDTSTGACVAAFPSGTTVNVSLAYQCNNPITCIGGQSLTLTNNGTTTALAANPASGVSSYTTVPLRFTTANAEAPIALNYSDAGQLTLYARYNIPLGSGAGSGTYMSGSSQFVVQPYTLKLTNLRRTSDSVANPAAGSASGPVFIGAGQAFSASVTASNLQGNATPNFGQELAPAAVSLTPNLVLPASGHNPTVSGGFGAYSAGAASGSGFSWPEVGIITLTPTVANYLGSGVVNGTVTGNVGRFVPNTLSVALNTPVFSTACSAGAFSYVGQPLRFLVAPVITVTPQAFGGATTQNYTGALFRLANSAMTGRTYTATPASPGLDSSGLPATTTDPAIADLGTGLGTLTFDAGAGLKYVRASALAPFSANIALSINVIDLDGIAAANPVIFGSGSGIAFSTGATQYYGRLNLGNALGSELLDLPMSLVTQYYLNSAQGFVVNASDSCTTAPVITLSSYQLNLQAGETCVRDSGSPGASSLGCAVAAANRYFPQAAAGNFNLLLAAPGTGNSGAATVTATAPAWLQYLWNAGSGVQASPSAMATFGVYPGSGARIYQREVY